MASLPTLPGAATAFPALLAATDSPTSGHADRPDIALVEDGQARCAIVVGDGAPPPERFAAAELRRYLGLMAGADVLVAPRAGAGLPVYVGESGLPAAAAPELQAALRGRGEDGYLVRSTGEAVILLGNSPRATLFAVYHFLEKYLGCGWCVPGDDTVPRQTTIRLPLFQESVGPPAFPVRQLILFPYGGPWMEKNHLPHIDWLAKNRLNWAHPAPNGPDVWERNRSREVLLPEVRRRGLSLHVGGHTFNTFLPHDRYAAAHPDYYALGDDGTRLADGSRKSSICVSNEGATRAVAENINRWLDENPEVEAVDLWHNDSRAYCRCPRCTPAGGDERERWLAYTKSYVQFTNRVAGLVARRHPRVLVASLFYQHTRTCPPDVEPLADNVLAALALYCRNSQRTMQPLESSPQGLDQALLPQVGAWRARAKRFLIYEYYTFGEEETPIWSMLSVIREDLRFFRRTGIEGISSDQWGPGWYPLNMYAFARLAWDPELTVDALISDFCRRYYGSAAPAMAAYWGLLEEGLRESWRTETPVDWRDEPRRQLVRQALQEAESERIRQRIRAAAALHKLPVGDCREP
ncbi:MAG: DUF4838 domain-containing protein [Armatimonadetes bacterium]|nr:DUF4838 domain-containing protein [Armatimonadota bacterium]